MIAIVDDEELIRGSLQGLMKAAGFPALTFASAEELLNSGEQERTACRERQGWNSSQSRTKIFSRFLSSSSQHRPTKECDYTL